MATVVIQKRARKNSNSYVVGFKEPLTGKYRYYKTFKRKKDAQQAANDLRITLDAGKLPDKQQTKLSPLKFNEVASSLKRKWDSKLQRKDLSEKTFTDYCIWLNVLNQIFGDNILCQILEDDIRTYRDTVASKFTNVTANKHLSIIKKVFNHGLELKALIENPVQNIEFLSEKNHVRNQFLLPDELDNLIEVTQRVRAKFYLPAIIYLGAEHGAAKQEVLSLKWSDIHFEFKEKGLIKLFRTKNKRKRTEFMMPRTKKALLEWRDHLKWMRHRRKIKTIKSDHVFCHLDGTPIKCFNKAWWRTLELAGIEDFHFHDLRHTFCSNLILSGSGLKEAKEMIGHADISMTDRYTHLSLNHKLDKQEQLAEHYGNGEIQSGLDIG
jgi:integrase